MTNRIKDEYHKYITYMPTAGNPCSFQSIGLRLLPHDSVKRPEKFSLHSTGLSTMFVSLSSQTRFEAGKVKKSIVPW
jgi:hypothetical protein